MIKHKLIEGFRNSTSGNKEKDGLRVLNNDLVSEYNCVNDTSKLEIITSVISENLFNEYSCKLDIDKKSKEVLFTHCSCADFEKKSSLKKNYCCKHLAASFYRFIRMLDNDREKEIELGLTDKNKKIIKATEKSILDYLINKDSKDEELQFEIYFNKNSWSNDISVDFKVGLKSDKRSKMYALKDIEGFMLAMENRVPINYGRDFIFDIRKQKLGVYEKKLIKFINLIRDMDYSKTSYKKINEKHINGKNMVIPKVLLRDFVLIAKNFRTYLGSGFFSRFIETEIIEGNFDIPMNIRDLGEMIKLDCDGGLPLPLTDMDDVFLYGTDIYIPDDEYIDRLMPFIEAFNHGNTIFFTKEEEGRVLKELVPVIQKVTNDVELSKSLREKIIVAPVKFKFYFDREDYVVLKLNVCYDKYEFNYFYECYEKVIYRDKNKEDEVVKLLKKFGFEAVNNKFVFVKGDDYIFDFFKYDILDIQKYGEVYYSDRFQGIKSVNSNSIKAKIKKGKYDYFNLSFTVGDIPEEETVNILRAFRDNKKYFMLKSGEYLDLEDIELKTFLKLLDSLEDDNNLKNNTIDIPKSRGMYVEDYIEDNSINYIESHEDLKSLKDSICDLKKEKFKVPGGINANLREYQKYGYNWLKYLDYMGFGGILGDEMGLGKTLQAITFLASNENTHSLVVAPTSLIYNWLSEFKKFAPHLKVVIVNGNKKDREKIIKDYDKFDCLITTYNLLRIDIKSYEDIKFDYCIIDEAQNIKNYKSLAAKAVKKINSRNRFALTGTPLENSLLELWSIFDFIMPGYLYTSKKFSTRFDRRLEEDDVLIEELNRLIKPFILRRYKKDVIHELPPKIEKKLVVPMTKEQMKVYETYNKYVKQIIENKVKSEEFKSSKIEILAYLTKLRELAIDPSVVMDNYIGESGKIEALLETVSQSVEEGHKILVFSQFTGVLKNIAKKFYENDIKYNYLDGSTKPEERIKLVNEFNSNNDIKVFLISLKAGGTGLNLTSADIVIHFDPWWNPAVEDQASDRSHRIGQKKIVEVIKMVSEGTIEEKILDLQAEKKKLIDKVIGSNEELGELFSSIDEKEVLSLFMRN